MKNRYVAVLLKQHLSHRLAHDIGTAKDNSIFPFEVKAFRGQIIYDPLWGAGVKRT